jgi:hypothetical protein
MYSDDRERLFLSIPKIVFGLNVYISLAYTVHLWGVVYIAESGLAWLPNTQANSSFQAADFSLSTCMISLGFLNI